MTHSMRLRYLSLNK
ncbi:erythromycin resistance leader peptide [Ureibacillus sp. 179-F W5.1 NHS]|uniref:Uncharacterized protein n=1 Tax=Lysinibacillus halotolerans TaxID=1368476 RepID=A0A3M8H6V2_9BACI|nr:hypothetical protein EC501_12465 [Lysinibacillus halotolerans]